GLLIRCAVIRNPVGSECLLLFMKRELVRAGFQVLLPAAAQIGAEPSMRLGRNIPHRRNIRASVKEYTALLRFDDAPPRRWGGVRDGTLRRIAEKRSRDRDTTLLVGFTALRFRCLSFRSVCALELVVSGCFPKQLLDFRWCIVRWRRVDADDAAVAIQLVTGTQSQSRDAMGVNADQVQPIRRHLQRELLHRFAIAAIEQRRLASLLREEVHRSYRQRLRRTRNSSC